MTDQDLLSVILLYQERMMKAADNNDFNAMSRIAGAWRAFASSTPGAAEMASQHD